MQTTTFDIDTAEGTRISHHLRDKPGEATTIAGQAGQWRIVNLTTEITPDAPTKVRVEAERNG